jgi:hypothetical protein
MASDTLTNVRTSTAGHSFHEMEVQWPDQIMLPGMKQRIDVPSDPLIGQTTALPAGDDHRKRATGYWALTASTCSRVHASN